MTPEELLRPKYKVIADYFYNPYKIGDIITVEYEDRSIHLTTTQHRDEFGETVQQANYFHPKRLDDFPHLFQRVEWWEGLKPEEMPSYVKHKNGNIYKVSEYSEGLIGVVIEGGFWAHLKNLFPATKEQYEEYIKQKQ
jgi:hypothetical protein